MPTKLGSRLALPATSVLLLTSLVGLVTPKTVEVPKDCRTEGRLILSYTRDNSTFTHHYTFSEYLNLSQKQSKVTIGYVSHPPITYYKRSSHILKISSGGLCKRLEQTDTSFIPEISWFLPLIKPLVVERKDLNLNVGPTGFLKLFFFETTDFVMTGSEIHRNIDCHVFTKKSIVDYISVDINVLIPKRTLEKVDKLSMPTARGRLIFNKSPQSFEGNIREASFQIDYFYIANLDNPTELISDRSTLDSNIPEGKGCSEYLNQIKLNLDTQSFTMIYKRQTNSGHTMMAYDASQNLLKREVISEQSSIWDLSEELLYNMQPNITHLLHDQLGLNQYSGTCSVTKVTDEKLSSAYRPYRQSNGQVWDLMSFLGAKQLAYIGQGQARELPCVIYETVSTNIPPIFGYSELTNPWKVEHNGDYIIQFHLVESVFKEPAELSSEIQGTSFWPARITLLGRNIEQDTILKLDQIDIHDFYWSLDGRNKRRSELFIAGECFSDEDEQVRLEISLTFDEIHTGVVDETKKRLLAVNKFKLEYDLLNEICKLLDLNRIHLISSKLSLRPNHVLLDVTFGDRKESKILTYFGEGTLVNENSYQENRMVVTSLSEERCIMLSSHIHQISMVLYCPKLSETYESSCISVYSEEEATVKWSNESSLNRPCHVYRFKSGGPPIKGALKILENNKKLSALTKWSFSAKDPQYTNTQVQLSAHLEDYELSHNVKLVTINGYQISRYLQDESGSSSKNPNVVSFGNGLDGTGIEVRDAHDCARICNLDPWCRSFSYCSIENTCSISKLDLRDYEVQKKLFKGGPSNISDMHLLVHVNEVEKYELIFSQGCNIHERNYLNMFNPTNEIVRMRKSDAYRYPTAHTTFDCAKMSVGVEMRSGSHHVAMFAFCPSQDINSCLLDENLFKDIKTIDSKPTIDEEQYIRCKIYKRKIHTYFDMSSKVISVGSDTSLQVKLPFKTVEECARACWTQYGQICSSFDYCTSRSDMPCIINEIETTSPEVKLEIQPGCLHYERDLRFDKILTHHMIGRHEALNQKTNSEDSSPFWGHLVTFVTYCIVGGVFVYGMSLGQRANDELDNLLLRFKSPKQATEQSFVNYLNNANSMAASLTRSGSSELSAIELKDVQGRVVN